MFELTREEAFRQWAEAMADYLHADNVGEPEKRVQALYDVAKQKRIEYLKFRKP